MPKLFRKLRWIFRRRRKESDLLEEVAFHLDEETAVQESAGLTRENAQRATRLQFGNPTLVQEDVRSTWSWIVVEQFRQDLSYAARSLWRARGFTAGAVAVLALGMGANLALLQIIDSTIVHRYSIPDAETFVRFSQVSRDRISRTFPSAGIEFYRAHSSSFASLISEDASFTVAVEGMPGRRSTFVSDNYFSNVRILPSLGRIFDPQDARSDASAVALLSHQYWQTWFGADPQVLGRIIQVNNAAVQIVGVLPDNFHGFSLQQTDLWFPVNNRPLLVPGSPAGQSEFFGKLKPGTSAAPGAAELTAVTPELARQQPRYFAEDDRIEADLAQESLVHFFLTRSPVIVILLGMVFLVLLSACAHLGNLVLVRGLGRQHELAIRAAIGASRSRLIRQLVTENILLAILGSAAGLAVGVIVARLVLISAAAPPGVEVSLHWQTLVACIVMTFISVFAFGLPSAKETTRPGFPAITLRSRFVANQVSVSCVLLIVTGAFAVQGMLDAPRNLNFDYRNIIVVDPRLYASQGQSDAAQRRLDALSVSISELPGVESVTAATAVPLGGRVVENFPQYPRINRRSVAPTFFAVMGLSVTRGRTFLPGEQDAAIASESAARFLWPNQNPLGQLWNVAGAKHTVVGVVQDSGASELNTVEAYVPISQRDIERCILVVHSRGNPDALVAVIPRAAAVLDESVSVTPMSALRDVALQRGQNGTKIFGSISLVASALAAAGMFALMAFTVVQRTREIGIRIAIGATRMDLLLGLLRLHAKPLAGGVVKGTFAAVMLLLFVRALVFPAPWVVLLGGLALGLIFVSAVAALATVVPALRALRIDPSRALRAE